MNFQPITDTLARVSALLLGLCLAIQASLLLAAEPPVHANTVPAVVVSGDARGYESATHSLAYLLGGRTEATLRYTDAQLDIPVPLGFGQKVVGANLRLRITPSAALNSQSWMAVLVNGQVVDQFSLAGNQGTLKQKIALPGSLFRPGFNTIELRAAQHYTWHCEYPVAPQIWSQVQLRDSNLTLKLASVLWRPNLSDLDQIFNPAQSRDNGDLRLFYDKNGDSTSWAATALVVEGAALRYQYLPLRVQAQSFSAARLQTWLEKSAAGVKTAIFVGSAKTLEPVLRSAQVQASSQFPELRILRWPGHPHHLGVAFVGQGEPLVELAHAFAYPDILWPPLPQASVIRARFPPNKNLSSPERVSAFSDNAYSLKDLGFATQTHTGYDPAPFELRIWNGGWQRKGQLRLHLAYAAGMSAQSALNVVVNGSALDSIPLNNPQGGRYNDYTVTLPTSVLHPGWNVVRLEPILVPQSNGGDCRPFFPGNLWVTVYGDSAFQWMGGGLRMHQPDLAPLAQAAYPFNGQNRTLIVQVVRSSAANVSAAMTLLGKLAQVAGRPLPAQFVVQAKPLSTSNIYVGSLQGDDAWDSIPGGSDALFQENPGVASARPKHGLLTLLQEPMTAQRARAHLHWDAEDRNSLAFLRIWKQEGQTHLLLVAGDAQQLERAAHTLIQYGPWAQLKGDMAWWRVGSDQIFTLGMTETPFRTFGVRGGFALIVSRHPWISLAVLLFLGLIFVLASRYALTQYARRRQRTEVAETDALAVENLRSSTTSPSAAAPAEESQPIPADESLPGVDDRGDLPPTVPLPYSQSFRFRVAQGGWYTAAEDPRHRRIHAQCSTTSPNTTPYPYWF